MPTPTSLRLHHEPDDADAEARLAHLGELAGERVGLDGVRADLGRRARLTAVPGRACEWGMTWEDRDADDTTWWPQGISAPGADETVLTTWYAKPTDGRHRGSRLSVIDLATLRYEHVLLARAREDGTWLSPVRVHAGGLARAGDSVMVAATRRGLLTARLGDVRRVREPRRFFGHRFVLPVSGLLRAEQDDGEEPLRYSFCSLERHEGGPNDGNEGGGGWLHVGEYARPGMTRRLVRFALDPATEMPPTRRLRAELLGEGPLRMQGAAVVDGRHHLTTSAGPHRAGSLHVGDPATGWRTRTGALPIGPEDLDWSPRHRLLWSLSEYPGRRYVYAVRPPG